MAIENKPKKHDAEDAEKLSRGLAYRTNRVDTLIKKLESATYILPRVDADGSSECHFAESLYAQKEKAERKLVSALNDLKKGLADLNKEMSRCQRNLDTIRRDSEKLTLKEPQDDYLAAEQELGKQLRDMVERRNCIKDVMKRADLALEIAQRRKFPGKIPQERGFGSSEPSSPADGTQPSNPPQGPAPPTSVASPPESGRVGELGDLLSIGPLR